MRVAIAAWGQETSSFSPVVTNVDTFRIYGIREGQAVLEEPIAPVEGLLDIAITEGVEWKPVPLFSAWAGASGIITADTLDYFEKMLVLGLKAAGPVDAFFFALHGAGQAENIPDTEGHLLAISRLILGNDVPIVITLDHHANITQKMMDNIDGLVGHRTQPHDPYDTGKLGGKQVFDLLRGVYRPTLAWRKIPLITHQEQYLTDREPMKHWFDLAREIETRTGVVSASTFPMQPWLDVPEAGWAAVVVTNNDLQLANDLSEELANKAWAMRDEFLKLDSIPIDVAVSRAIAANNGLVILADSGDSVAAGGPGDSTDILAEMLRQNLNQQALVPVVDPEVVDIAIKAGIGSTITVLLGGKLDPKYGTPTQVTATVAGIGGGILNPEDERMPFNVGRAALLKIGSINVVVGETRGIGVHEPVVYRHFGLEPVQAKMVVLKTASNWQNYSDLISEVVRVDTPGSTMSRIEEFEWTHLPRPIYPLDS